MQLQRAACARSRFGATRSTWLSAPRSITRLNPPHPRQFEIAVEFDKRYGDVVFVRDARHWPPRLVAALERFLAVT